MGKQGRLFIKIFLLFVCIGVLPFICDTKGVHAEGPNDPAPQITPSVPNGKKVLFDNTHGQTAGAADWVIDGGFSDFANAIANEGFFVKELRKTSPITYDDLKNYQVFVIGEANIPYKKSEQEAMRQYVENGGSIFFIADHYNADRNKNRWDASEVMNGYRRGAYSDPAKGMSAEEKNSAAMQGVESSDWLSSNFGIRFRYNAVGDVNATTIVSPKDAFGITEGVQSVAVHAGSTLAITDPKKAKGLVYLPALTKDDKWANSVDQGVYFGGGKDEGPFAAISKVGKGKAAFIGDSSPVEDASPKYLREENGSKKKTYDGFKEQNDARFLTNLVNWLAKEESYTSFDQAGISLDEPSPQLDFETPSRSTEPQPEPWAAPDPGYKWYDPSTFAAGSYGATKEAEVKPEYSFVHQDVLPNAETFQIRVSVDHLLPGQTVSDLKVGIYLDGGTQVAQFQKQDGTWPTSYDYSDAFSMTADSFGHAKKEWTVRIKPGTKGTANLRLKIGKTNILTKTVTIDNVKAVPLPEDRPQLPEKISIADARGKKEGSIVTVEGIVTTEPGIFGGKGFYLQDGSAGIYIFQDKDGFHPGDVVNITAPIAVFNNERELTDPIAMKKVGTSEVPKAEVVDEVNEQNQGQFVRLENVVIQNLMPLNRAFEFDAIRNGKTTRVRVDERTGVTYSQFTEKFHNGDFVHLSGISSIYKDVYQLKLFNLKDVEWADTEGPVIHDLDKLSFFLTDTFEEKVAVTDEGSGVAEVSLTLDGKAAANPIHIDPLQLLKGEHTLAVTAVDRAGNKSERTFTLEVKMDTDHLDELLAIGSDKGYITHHGIINSLSKKIEGIQKAKSEAEREERLTALINEIKAQSGKKIDTRFAEYWYMVN